jgi:hypothetical protein
MYYFLSLVVSDKHIDVNVSAHQYIREQGNYTIIIAINAVLALNQKIK